MLYLCAFRHFGGMYRTQIGLFEAESEAEAINKCKSEVLRLNPDFLTRASTTAVPVGKMLTIPTPKGGSSL